MSEKREMSVMEIAKQLQLSTTTVSRALSGKGRIGGDTVARVRAFLEENNITPNVRESRYSDRKTMNIGVVIPAEQEYCELPFFTRILLTLYDFFVVRGYNIIVIKTSAEDIKCLEEIVKKHKIDGAVLTRVLDNCADINFLKEKQVPFVVTGSVDDDDVYQVDVNQRGGCRELTDIFFKLGMRKIALFCSNRRQTVTQERVKGYLDAVRGNDLPFESKYIVENAGEHEVQTKAIDDMLKEQAECIICSDDGICISLLDSLRQLGVEVPRDIRVASFFNSRMLEETNSSITSLNFDIRELGRTAGTMLLKVMEEKPCEKRMMLGYQIVLKDSTNNRTKR